MSDSVSLEDLLNRAKQGENSARDELFRLTRNYVQLMARVQMESWLQKKVDASDLVQQTLLDAHRDFSTFLGDSEGEWLAWLKRILSNNAIDLVRHYGMTAKRQIKREVSIEQTTPSATFLLNEPVDTGDTPSQIVMQKEHELILSEAISVLSADYREVIILRNLQRLSFEEVAQRMNRSRGATQMLWMRAVQKLKETLQTQIPQ